MHHALRTRFCELVGCRLPIVQTGMGWVSGANLTAATSAAGGFGILAAVTMTPDQLRDWCQQAGTRVTVRPVLDLNENLTTDSYETTPLQKEQAWLTHPCCVFPGCTRPSRGKDTDHITAHPFGRTESRNLAPLCRFHHRIKTHAGWTYTRTGPRTFQWVSPMGHRYVTESDRHIR